MATTKKDSGARAATTTADLTSSPEDVEALTRSAVDLTPTRSDSVAAVEDATDPDMVAKTADVKYVKVKAPSGEVSTVPDSIVDALLESGYSKTK